MIPKPIIISELSPPVLPPGIHMADLTTVKRHLASSKWRQKLFNGLVEACRVLSRAGSQRLYLDGSFVTPKPIPNDYDVCWDLNGVNLRLVDLVFFDFSNGRAAQKAKFGGEFFPSTHIAADADVTFLEFFQIDTGSGKQKGIIGVDLANDPVLNPLRP